MKMFKKYANLALISALLVATIPAYSMETDEVTDTTEPVETVWYKRPAAKHALVATTLVVIGVKTYFNYLSSIARAEQNKNDMDGLMKDLQMILQQLKC